MGGEGGGWGRPGGILYLCIICIVYSVCIVRVRARFGGVCLFWRVGFDCIVCIVYSLEFERAGGIIF